MNAFSTQIMDNQFQYKPRQILIQGLKLFLPLFQFLAIDACCPLVALSNAHLMPTALHILAGVLSGVDSCEHVTKINIVEAEFSVTAKK